VLEQWEKVAAAAKGPTVVLDENDAETPVKSLDDLWRVALEKCVPARPSSATRASAR